MKVKLRRKGPLEVFEAICSMEVYRERKDILSLLEIIDTHGVDYKLLIEKIGCSSAKIIVDGIVDGIIEYLKKLNLLREDNILTDKARKFIKSKKFPSLERGQYSLWMFDDPLIGKVLIYFERTKNELNNLVVKEDYYYMEKKKYINIIDDTEFCILKFERSNEITTINMFEKPELKTDIILLWDIDLRGEPKYHINLSGQLKKSNAKKVDKFNKEIDVQIDINLKKVIIDLISENYNKYSWNDKIGCFAIPYDKDLSLQTLLNFLINLTIEKPYTNYGIFEETQIFNVPIMPLDVDDARSWFEVIIKDFLGKGYINNDDFLEKISTTLNLLQFKSFDLSDLDSNYFARKLKQDNAIKEYWHLQASLDFKLKQEDKFVLDTFDMRIDTKMSMRELVQKIIGKEIPRHLIYCSKYVKEEWQKKKFELFVTAFKEYGVQEIDLISSEKKVFTDTQISVCLYENIFGDRKNWPHDRYFAFDTENGWYYYKMSAELDQCKFDDALSIDDITIDVQGMWKDISIYRLDSKVFPKDIYDKFLAV